MTGVPPKAAKPKRVYTKMTVAMKAEAIVLFKSGNMTADEIAKRFGASPRTLEAYFARMKVKHGDSAAATAARVSAVIDEALILDPLVHARRVFDTKNETYRITEMLRKLVAGEIVKCRQEGRKLGTIQNEIKTIREAAQTIKLCREEAFAVLGIRPEDQGDENLPELTVTDLTQEDIADLQQMPSADDMGDVTSELEADSDEVSEGFET